MGMLNPYLDFGLANVLVPGSNKGRIVYVDTAANGGDDGNSGLRVAEAKVSIHGALAVCTDYMWDTIIVLNHENAEVVEWPIALDKVGVRIFGAPGGGWSPRYTGGQIIQSTGDKAGFSVEASHIRIEGFEFRVGAGHAGIEFGTAGISRHGIFNCRFTGGLYGIWATALQKPSQGPHIKGCHFVKQLTSDGIRYASDGPFTIIEDNVFDSVTGIAIHISGTTSAAGMIRRNVISLVAATAAKAIVFSANNHYRWIIDANHANYGRTDMANNPYLDESTEIDGVNDWMLNYAGSAVIMPAIA